MLISENGRARLGLRQHESVRNRQQSVNNGMHPPPSPHSCVQARHPWFAVSARPSLPHHPTLYPTSATLTSPTHYAPPSAYGTRPFTLHTLPIKSL